MVECLEENEISGAVLDAAIMVHTELGGPGLLESVYEEALSYELTTRGLLVERQVAVPITYKGKMLATALRIDLLVAGKVIVECKAVELLNPICRVQVLTYLRLKKLKLGLLINFGASTIKQDFSRIINSNI